MPFLAFLGVERAAGEERARGVERIGFEARDAKLRQGRPFLAQAVTQRDTKPPPPSV